MSFPFPPNPIDGQVATQTQPDGTVLKATYIQAKNEWVVERVAPKDPTLTLTAGTAYTVAPGKDGQVLTYDKATNQWVGKTPANAAGGKGQTFTKGTQAAADTPNPPDPTRPTEMLQAGALQTTLENLHKELKAWDGTAWAEVFTEDTIKQWIAAGSLFRGVIKEADLATLPDVALANRGFYWSWTGAPGYVVQKGDAKIGTDLENEVLQVGDWIQSDGTKWVHVPGDLLSKQRWDSLGSFQPWSDTSWESGSVISYQKAFFRASTLVAKGDLAPGATPANPGEVQKWVDITPLPSMSTGDLNNVNANTIRGGGVHGAVFQWDDNIGEWVSSDVLDISEVKTGTVKFGDLYGEITGVESVDLDATDPADDSTFVPSVWAVKEYVKAQPKPFLEELDDCVDLGTATNGQVPSWDAANSKWVPYSVSSLAPWDPAKAYANNSLVLHNNKVYANIAPMVAGLEPGVTAGAATETITAGKSHGNVVFTDVLGSININNLKTASAVGISAGDFYLINLGTHSLAPPYVVSGGAAAGMDLTTDHGFLVRLDSDSKGYNGWAFVPDPASANTFTTATVVTQPSRWSLLTTTASGADLDGLSDVTLSVPADKQVLQYELTSKQWKNVTPDYLNPTNGYTKTEVDTKLTALATGLEHYEAVLSRVDTPPAAPTANDLYIVGATPTGLWTGQANNLARWDGTAWQFEAPKASESHLIENVAETWHWNGTAWVKVAAASTGAASGAGDLWMVGAVQQSMLTETEFKSLLNVTEQDKWCLADGRNVAGTKYATTTGRNTVPDLRGAYLRMAGVNHTNSAWDGGTLNGFQEDNTARPKNAFTAFTSTNGVHNHSFTLMRHGANYSTDVYPYNPGGRQHDGPEHTDNAGSHNHSVTITAGGDTETRPKSYSVNYFIKIN